MATVLYPTSNEVLPANIFLAGTIEMGNSIDWQKSLIEELQDYNVVIANPRRDSFNQFSKEEIAHQISWELDNLAKADIVFMYLAPGTISPISLLELGLLLGKGKQIIVCCPDGYSRKDNVTITCAHNWSSSENCKLTDNMEAAVVILKKWIGLMTDNSLSKEVY